MRKYLALIVVAFIVWISVNPVANTQVYVTDALGKTIIINQTPSRIVSLSPSITEILASLGLLDKLVGVDSISYNTTYLGINEYVRSHGVEDIGGYWWSTISVEKILALHPDLVFADKGAHVPLMRTLEEYNLTVVFLYGGSASSLEDIYNDVGIIAQIFNIPEDKVYLLIDLIEKNITAAKKLLTGAESRKVLVVVGFYNGIWVAGKATFIDDIINRLGLVNAAQVVGWKAVNIETIIQWSPDIIIVTNMGGVTNETIKQYGLTSINVPIILLNSTETDTITRPGPRIGLGALTLAHKIAEYFPPKTTTPVTKTVSITKTTTATVTKTTTIASTSYITETKSVTQTIAYENLSTPSIALFIIAGLIIGIGAGFAVGKKW